MSLSKNDIKKIGKLARIRLQEAEIDELGGQINGILKWIEQLQEVNTDNIEPMAGVGNYTLRLRKDEMNDGGIVKDVTKNAPRAEYDCYVVPKVVE